MSRLSAKPATKPPEADTSSPRTLPIAWRKRIVAILEAGIARLADPALLPARRIQKARQSTKAARALLRLAPKAVLSQALGVRMVLGSARRKLSETRDTDALIETMETVLPDAKLSKANAAALRKLVEQRRATFHADLPADIERARMLLTRAAQQAAALTPPRGTNKALVTGIVTDYRKLRKDSASAFAGDDIEALHDLRKRVIVHRHHCAFMAESTGKTSWSKRAVTAKALHEALGNHRDLALLDNFLRPQQNPKLTPAIGKLLLAIEKRQDALLADAPALAARLNRIKPGKLRTRLDDAISG